MSVAPNKVVRVDSLANTMKSFLVPMAAPESTPTSASGVVTTAPVSRSARRRNPTIVEPRLDSIRSLLAGEAACTVCVAG